MRQTETASRLQEARALYEEGKEQEAIDLLSAILEQEPNDMAARELLGDIYYARGAYRDARRQYRYVFDRRRHEVDAALKLAEVYLCLPKKMRQAYNVLRRTVEYNPEHLTALLRYANFCRVLIRDEEDVAALYERIEQFAAGDVEKELACANDHLFTDQLERARAACQRALDLCTDEGRVHRLLYHIHLKAGALELARAAAERVLELEGPSASVWHDLAGVSLEAEDWTAALDALSQALTYAQGTDEQVVLLREVATLQIKLEMYVEAVQTLEKALSVASQDIVLLYSLVVVYQQMTDYAAALDVLETRLRPLVGEQDQQARQLQGVLYLQAEQPTQARDTFAALLKENQDHDHLPQQANYYYYLALAEHHLGHKVAARQAVNRALRRNRHHAQARTLYQELNGHPAAEEDKAESPKSIQEYFEPLDLQEFLEVLDIQEHLDKLIAYIEMRYWKNRDPRGKKPKVPHRTIVLMRIVMGFKDWNLNQLYEKLRSKKHGGALRELLGLPDDPQELAVYTTFERRINTLGVYPIKFLMRQMVREAVQEGYIDVSSILLDTSLIAAYSDLARFFPDSPTGFSEGEGAWSYPKPWTGRILGFKLSLATAKDGEPIDADLVPANPNDITQGKQAIRRLGRTFAPLNIKVEFVIADGGYCSDPLRQLVAEVLGAMPLFRFNPRNGSRRQPQYTYLDDKEEWLKVKRQLRQLIERSFAQLKKHFGLNNLCIRGLTQVAQYVLSRCLAYLACVIVAHKVGRPDLKASPHRLLYSY